MSASRTFDVTPKSTAVVDGDLFTHVEGEKLRQDLDLLAYCGDKSDLGGSDDVGLLTASFVPVIGYRDFVLNGDSLGGMTLEAVVYYRTEVAATTVQVRLRNITDNSNAAAGAVSGVTSITKETLTLTLASGDKTYRLEITGSDAVDAVYGFGYLRIRKVPS